MSTVCDLNKCTGCRACIEACKINCIRIDDTCDTINAFIDANKCINCGVCKRVCQVNNPVSLVKPTIWYQGWATDDVRKTSSSGGIATALMLNFIGEKRYVCSCAYIDGEFKYIITNNPDKILQMSGSKYVKSKLLNIYQSIEEILVKNELLFIGLPCHVAALKNFLGNSLFIDKLTTVDIICHGSPSVKLLIAYLREKFVDIGNIDSIQFRVKGRFGISTNCINLVPYGVLDAYTMGFLRGLFYTENCYACKYAQFNRVGDLTIGDAWGTDLVEELKNGVSLILCQTEKGIKLIRAPNIKLHEIDINSAIKANIQLQHPMEMPRKRALFFGKYKTIQNFSKSVFYCYPYDCVKQKIKTILIKYGLFHPHKKQSGGGYLIQINYKNI